MALAALDTWLSVGYAAPQHSPPKVGQQGLGLRVLNP